MTEMICDKCKHPVEPSNNTKLYDAALAAQIGYQPLDDYLLLDFVTFRNGEIVHGDPRTSMQNVLSHTLGRHFDATDDCEGSPSRRGNVERGQWGNGEPMRDAAAEAARRAYEQMQGFSAAT